MGKKISIHQSHKFRGQILPGISRRSLKITQSEVDEAVRLFMESEVRSKGLRHLDRKLRGHAKSDKG